MTDKASFYRARLLKLRAAVLVFLLSVCSIFAPQAWSQQELASENPAASYEALAQALSNDEVRQQLIDQLQTLAAQEPAPATADVLAPPVLPEEAVAEEPGLVGRLQVFAQGLRADVAQAWKVLLSLGRGDQAPVDSLRAWQPALLHLLLTALVAIAAYVLLRVMVRPIFRRFDRWAQRIPSKAQFNSEQQRLVQAQTEREAANRQAELQQQEAEQSEPLSGDFAHLQTAQESQPVAVPEPVPEEPVAVTMGNYVLRYRRLRKLCAVIGALLVDFLVIFLAALVAYIAALVLPGQGPAAILLAMQFLTAFVAVESVKALSRGVFATGYEQLRLLPIDDQAAAFWHAWLSRVVVVGGYGLLVLVPVLQTVLSRAFANVLGAVLILCVYLYAVGVLWRKRHSVSSALQQQAEQAESAVFGTVLRIFARLWLWLALAYFTVLFFATQADQQNALSFMAKASVKTAVVVLLASAISMLLSALMMHRLHLPERWARAFPLLENRLNSYIPASLRALRLLVFALALLSIFDAWQVFDLRLWLSQGQGQQILNTVIRVALVLFIAAMSWTVLASIIEHRLSSSGVRMPTEREKTLLMLFRNALAILIITMTTLIVLSQVGIDIGPLIAGAGVVGLAIGFGAQKLVQDVITGVFIQLENGMNQNDVVEVAGLFGVVEKLTIRSVVIRTLDGGYHLVPFSAIDCVANHTRDYGYHYGEYCVGLRESVDEAIACLESAFADTRKDPEVAQAILEDISIPGVTALTREGFTIRVLIKTTPGMQWAVQRSFNRCVKMHFDAAGIELPYPHTVLHFGRDKNGHAAPADIRMVDAVAQRSRSADTRLPPPEGAAS